MNRPHPVHHFIYERFRQLLNLKIRYVNKFSRYKADDYIQRVNIFGNTFTFTPIYCGQFVNIYKVMLTCLFVCYNVMRFRETMGVDEAEVLAGRYKSVSGRYYVLHDPEKFTDKYITAWKNFGIDINKISAL